MVGFINHKIKVALYYLRRIGSIRKYITTGICHKLVVALVTSNIDYCNGLLGGLAAEDRPSSAAPELCSKARNTLEGCNAYNTYPQRLTLAAHSSENKL